MKIEFGNYMDLTDEALASLIKGHDGLIFAAGIDERVEGSAPVYEMFKKFNITPLERLLRIAKANGVKQQEAAGHEGGLNMIKFTDIMCTNTFIDKNLGCVPLGVEPDDIDAAISESVKLSLQVLDGKTEAIDMKGE